MKIHETRTAPNPRRVRIFLAEKAIAMTYVEHDLAKGALRTPEFMKLNPLQRVPVLELDDGTMIAETMAICRYFEVVQPEPALFGKGAKERAVTEMWNRRMELDLLASVAAVFRHGHPAMAALEVPQVKDWGEANKPKAQTVLRLLDEQLGRHAFVAGDNYSVADITALCAIDFMRPARLQRPEGLGNLERWYKAVTERPSAKS